MSIRYKLGLGLLAACLLGIVIDNWILDRYIIYPSTNIKGTPVWSNFRFYAIGNNRYSEGKAGSPMVANDYVDVNTTLEKINDTCRVPRFEIGTEQPEYVSCRRPPPVQNSCKVADKVFFSEPTPDCSHQETHIICQIQTANEEYLTNCSNSICPGNTSLSLGLINTTIGVISWTFHSNVTLVENTIQNLLKKNESNGNYGFCFLNCTMEDGTVARQLLLMPKHVRRAANNTCQDQGDCELPPININVIWLDSTSHSHFHRSMPATVSVLRTAKSDKHAHVFSYNLMQSMKGGTYVNTVAFTSGKIISRNELLKKHIPIGNLLKSYRKGGYDVTFVDDLCWTWSTDKCACGYPKFLGVVFDKKKSTIRAWKNIQKALMLKGIDQVGISLSNCEIMQSNNISNPFKDSVSICYNGLHQTHYIMNSLEMSQASLHAAKRQFFHYLDLNLGHEASGRRIQTLDENLAKFLEFSTKRENTLTLMFGDHGNKYGTFVKQTRESKIEMAHPVLFVIASKNLDEKLGKDKLDALELNQDRLVNILDLRQTLLYLAPSINNKTVDRKVNKKYDTHPDGLFHAISPKRSCKTMGIQPEEGRCICQQGHVNPYVTNTTGAVLVLADFALGEINNMIQKQYMLAYNMTSGGIQSGFGLCERLVGSWVDNVQETIIENFTVTEMDIYTPAGLKAPQKEDIFGVVIHRRPSGVKLIHYERTTTYAEYDECRDTGVDGDLCVCSPPVTVNNTLTVNDTLTNSTIAQWHQYPPLVFGHMTTVVSLNGCLFVYERRTPHGVVLETSCACADIAFQVVVHMESKINVVQSKPSPISIEVHTGMMVFIGSFHQVNPLHVWKLEYDVKFRQLY